MRSRDLQTGRKLRGRRGMSRRDTSARANLSGRSDRALKRHRRWTFSTHTNRVGDTDRGRGRICSGFLRRVFLSIGHIPDSKTARHETPSSAHGFFSRAMVTREQFRNQFDDCYRVLDRFLFPRPPSPPCATI